ncbi:hypothetical protein JCM9279_001132 [Rhodotorula babjevae]
MPLLPPPPPQFPTRFTHDTLQQQAEPPVQAEWPAEGPEGVDEDSIEWAIKTQREEHLDKLEARLAQLAAGPAPSSSSTPVGNRTLDSLSTLPPDDLDELDNTDLDVEAAAAAVEPAADGIAVGDEADEGRALLSAVGSPEGHSEAAQEGPHFSDDEQNAVLVAAAAEALEEGGTLDLPADLAPAVLQRISFGETVRISGGIRSSSRPHRHRHVHAEIFHPPPPHERTSLLSSQARPISAPSDLLVAAVTPAAGPSRSASPASRSRRTSMSSSHRSGTSFAHLHPSSQALSSSPASYGASRSSSPCSSIYAPLQPPSKFSPNPLWVRTSSQRGLRRSRSGASLSFQDFLRSGAAYASPDDEDDSDEEDDPGLAVAADELLDPRGRRFGPSRAEYRDLVEAQRARRERWEARRAAKEAHARAAEAKARKGARFWDRLARLLALGMAGAGPARAGASAGGGGSRNGHAVAQQQQQGGSAGAGRGRGRSPARPGPSPLGLGRGSSGARTPSGLSIESSLGSRSSSFESELDEDEPPPPRRSSGRPPRVVVVPRPPPLPRSSRPPVVKTEIDVRFGPAPARYLRLDWLRFKLAQLVLAARAALRTALVGLERQRGPRLEEGYEEV